jgi:hypothetical protein
MHTINIKMMDPFTVGVLAFVNQFDRFVTSLSIRFCSHGPRSFAVCEFSHRLLCPLQAEAVCPGASGVSADVALSTARCRAFLIC